MAVRALVSFAVVSFSSFTLANDIYPLEGRHPNPAVGTCSEVGEIACGRGCIPSTWTCCLDGSGGCGPSSYCSLGSNHQFGCCPTGQICSGPGSAVTGTTTSTSTVTSVISSSISSSQSHTPLVVTPPGSTSITPSSTTTVVVVSPPITSVTPSLTTSTPLKPRWTITPHRSNITSTIIPPPSNITSSIMPHRTNSTISPTPTPPPPPFSGAVTANGGYGLQLAALVTLLAGLFMLL